MRSSASKVGVQRPSSRKTGSYSRVPPLAARSTSRSSGRLLKKRSPLARTVRSAKRYSKQTLRDMLLSSMFNRAIKVFFGFLIIGTALYGVYAFIGNTLSNDVVVSKAEIITRVRKHIELPTIDPEAVVRVQDASTLQKENTLYSNVKEGDYIIIYPNLAVVYDLRHDHVIAMKSTR